MVQQREKPVQQRSIQTRDKIIATGLKLFCEVGYNATSSKKIAGAAGVATGTFYNHFKDKKALLLEIHRLHVEKVHKEVERWLEAVPLDNSDMDSRQMMRQMIMLVLKTHEFSPRLHREIEVLSHQDPDFKKMNRQEKKNAHDKLSNVLKPLASQMRISDFDAATAVISSAMEAVVHAIVMDRPPVARERLVDALADMLNRYLFET